VEKTVCRTGGWGAENIRLGFLLGTGLACSPSDTRFLPRENGIIRGAVPAGRFMGFHS